MIQVTVAKLVYGTNVHGARTLDGTANLGYLHGMNYKAYNPPLIRSVLEIIAEAGPDGIVSVDVARRFNARNERYTLQWTNCLLSRAKNEGYARRSPRRERIDPADKRHSCFRWWLTEKGAAYLNPKPVPQIVAMDEPPTSKRVLEILHEAGEKGIIGPDIARHFTIPEPDMPSLRKLNRRSQGLQRKLAWTNQILERFAINGYVRRGLAEASPYYHRVPAYRWFVTPAGSEYLAAGLSAGIREARDREREREAVRLAAHRRRLADLLTEAYDKYDPETTPRCERERVMRELRSEGCTLHDIGQIFGLTRERVRQILINYRVSPCHCPRHEQENLLEDEYGET